MKQTKMSGGVKSRRRRSPVWIAVAAAAGVLMILALSPALRGMLQADNLHAAPVAQAVSFAIVSPKSGAMVNSPVQLRMTVTGTELGRPFAGLDHLHVSVDGGPAQAIYKNRVLSLPLTPGKHIIAADLAGPAHQSLLPAKYVAFTVR